ncbi:MAG: DsrE family protein [Hyphomicrobium aestuarii]|nr:DsrE family protein [Hyphomicrobium aestuarii]
MSKTAIVVFSDPKAPGDEALGRVFNAMFLTLELKDKGQDVALIFQGAGTRWPNEMVQPAHPANALYHAVADKVAGVCGGCADVFGATDGVKAIGLTMVRDRAIPGTSGILDLSRYLDEGYRLVTL